MGLMDSVLSGDAQPTTDNAASAFNFFVGQGLAPHQAAGIVGNLQGESGQGLNPNAVNKGDGRDGSDSIGIGQWNGPRAEALKAYAASKGANWNDLGTQLEFLHSELQGPEKRAYAALQASTTPEEAGRAFMAYERPKDWNVAGSHPERARNAAAVYRVYGQAGQGGSSQPSQATPASPTEATPEVTQAPVLRLLQGGGLAAPQVADAGPQAAPIFFAPRRAPDITKLKAALQATMTGRG